MSDFQDLEIRCSDCGASFPFKATEQAFFAERSLTPPKRCKDCRAARKQDGGAGGGGGANARGPRERTGDRQGPPARTAMGNGTGNGPPHSASFGTRGRGASERDRGPAPSFANRAPRTREDGTPSRDHSAPMAGGPGSGDAKNFDPRDSRAGRVSPGPRAFGGPPSARPERAERPDRSARAARDDNRAAPTRQPARQMGGGSAPKWGRPQHAFADSAASGTSGSAGQDDNSGSGADESNARPERAPKEKRAPGMQVNTHKPKPRFAVTCQTCGAATDVPFEPIAGRPIFCQPCYRARRGTAEAASTSDSTPSSSETADVGIVE